MSRDTDDRQGKHTQSRPAGARRAGPAQQRKTTTSTAGGSGPEGTPGREIHKPLKITPLDSRDSLKYEDVADK